MLALSTTRCGVVRLFTNRSKRLRSPRRNRILRTGSPMRGIYRMYLLGKRFLLHYTSFAEPARERYTLAPVTPLQILPPPLLLPLFPVQCAPLPAATPPSAASRAPPRPGYGHRRQGPSATYRHGQGGPPHRPYGQSGGPGAKHSAYALSDTSGRVSLHRLARARASPAGTP